MMLRSRMRLGDTPRQSDDLYDLNNFQEFGSRMNRVGRSRFSRRRIGFITVTLLFLLSLYRIWKWRALSKTSGAHAGLFLIPDGANQDTIPGNTSKGPAKDKVAEKGLNSTWRLPLVNRMLLFQLEGSPKFMQDDSPATKVPHAAAWLPRVTNIPDRSSSRPSNPNSQSGQSDREPICGSSKHPRPCRFLFPVRIAEQESKARIHLLQLAQLAQRLNRTLVLPNVGKSKLGACFRWSFDTYYDTESFIANFKADVVGLGEFHSFLDGYEQQVNSRVFLAGSSSPVMTTIKRELYSNPNNSVYAYELNSDDNGKADLPTCFRSKYQRLDDDSPVFLSVSQPLGRDRPMFVGDSIVDAISATSSIKRHGSPVPELDVLVLNWDLRHPVFPPPYNQLQYSQRLLDLAARLAPVDDYLAVQWRMETVDPGLLTDCAYALIDVLGQLLRDESLARNTSTVWFASDYPYPIVRQQKTQLPSALTSKSGTFKDFEIRHEGAADILRTAFEKDHELDSWKLTDISEAMDGNNIDRDLLQDSGVLGILDKLISIKAKLFVSGSSRCGRKSSFTKQIVEARMNDREKGFHLANLFDTFG